MIIKIMKVISLSLFELVFVNAYEIGSFTLENIREPQYYNQDRFYVEDKKDKQEKPYDFFIGIFDGHQDFNVSGFLCQEIVSDFEDYLQQKNNDIPLALQKTFNLLDEQTRNYYSGSTAVSCCLKNGILYLANVGDSRAMLCRLNDFESTVEHKPEFGTAEADRIIKSGGNLFCYCTLGLSDSFQIDLVKIFSFEEKNLKKCSERWEYESGCEIPESLWSTLDECLSGKIVVLPFEEEGELKSTLLSKNWNVAFKWGGIGILVLAMSRALGDCRFKEIGVIGVPDIYTWPLQQGDKFLVLATDGLWDVMSKKEAKSFIEQHRGLGENAQQISYTLCHQARDKGSSDDITVIVVLLENDDFTS